MESASNSVLLAFTFFEGAAALILLVIYSLLTTALPSRFFRYWVAGWSVFLALQVTKITLLLNGAAAEQSSGLSDCFCDRILDSWRPPWSAADSAAGLSICSSAGLPPAPAWSRWTLRISPILLQWGRSLLESGFFLAAGWMLWRSQSITADSAGSFSRAPCWCRAFMAWIGRYGPSRPFFSSVFRCKGYSASLRGWPWPSWHWRLAARATRTSTRSCGGLALITARSHAVLPGRIKRWTEFCATSSKAWTRATELFF